MTKAWTVAKQSLAKNMKSFNYWFMILFPLIIFAIIFAIGYFSSQSDDDLSLVVVSDMDGFSQQLQSVEGLRVDEDIQTADQAEKALAEGDIDGFVLLSGTPTDMQAEMIHTMSLQDSAYSSQILSAFLNQFQMQSRALESGVDPAELAQLTEEVPLEQSRKVVEDGQLKEEGSNMIVTSVISYVLSFVIYIVIIFYPSIIVNDLATEKGTRVMEVILSSTTSNVHFLGKMLAVFIMLVIHFVIYALLFLLGFQLIKEMDMVQELLQMVSWQEIVSVLNIYLLVFVLIGIVTYVILSAFLGSASSSVEDAQKAVSPIVIVGMLGLFASMFGLTQPQHELVTISSYIPMISPFTMPIRILSETVSLGGIWLSILFNILFMMAVLVLTLVFYRANLLVYSDGNVWKAFGRSANILRSERQAKH